MHHKRNLQVANIDAAEDCRSYENTCKYYLTSTSSSKQRSETNSSDISHSRREKERAEEKQLLLINGPVIKLIHAITVKVSTHLATSPHCQGGVSSIHKFHEQNKTVNHAKSQPIPRKDQAEIRDLV